MTISAAQVKELRERTGAGMMECKKALVESSGDMEGAVEALRKAGIAKAGKKANRTAAEGGVFVKGAGKKCVMVEINAETDFVGRDNNFLSFADAVVETAFNTSATSEEMLSAQMLKDQNQTVEEARQTLITKVGENVQIRRIALIESVTGTVGTYVHGGRIGVIVELDTDNAELARDIAMHIAAVKPLVISPEHVAPDLIAKEKEIYMAQAAGSGKPQEIIEKMVMGRLEKFLAEISLTGQAFVKDPNVTIGNLLNKHRAKVLAFHRFEVGEGIEKVVEDFKEAVMSQIQG
ncbi:MAG TPA: translation elongation factor Ts [Gammaproteobacteria bacterium]|jgi:elongation factor Ts|nr:translation elongation factor Ts [Gammaproteobacteria bacterium]